MQIETNNNNIAYKGLTKKLSKLLYTYNEINRMVSSNKNSQGLVGHIPYQWVKQIPFDARRENITKFHKNMGFFVNKVLPFTQDSCLSSLMLTHIMRRSKIIPKNSSVKIKFVDEGSFAKGYLLTNNTTGDEFFLKRFKQLGDSLNIGFHGVLVESNNKMFIKSKFKKKDKAYFSNFHYADIKNNYYVEDYLSDKDDIAKNIKDRDKRARLYKQVSKEHGLILKLKQILNKYGLAHNDLKTYNIKIYNSEKGYKPICFDSGGFDYVTSCRYYVV